MKRAPQPGCKEAPAYRLREQSVNKKNYPQRRNIIALINSILAVLMAIGVAVTIHRVLRPVEIVWESRADGPTRSIVWAVALDASDPLTVYAGTDGGGVYKSTDGGTTWIQKNDGLESSQGQLKGIEHARNVRDILISRTQPGTIYVATWGPEGIYRSNDAGETWFFQTLDVLDTGDETDQTLLDESFYVRVLAETDTDILAGTDGGVFRLINPDGDLWQPTSLKGEEMSIRALVVHPHYPQTLYAATLGEGIYRSEDSGGHWQPKSTGLESDAARKVNALILDPADPNVVYAGTFGDGVYRSADGGESWRPWNEGLPPDAEVWSLNFAPDGALFAGLRRGGTYKRIEPGEWQKANFLPGALTLEVDLQTGAIYAGTWGGGLYRDEAGRDQSWEGWQNLGPPAEYLHLTTAAFASSVPYTFYVGTSNDGVYASQDGGESWERQSAGLAGKSLAIQALTVGSDGCTLYAGTGYGVLTSPNGGEQWTLLGENAQLPDSFSVLSLAIGRNRSGQDSVYAGTRQGLWVFDSSRREWDGPKEFESFKQATLVPSLLLEGEAVYASFWGYGAYKSSDLSHWQPLPLEPRYVQALILADKTWLQWGGRQFYALTEQGLYGSGTGTDWDYMGLNSVGTLTADPLHPQVAYASLSTIRQELTSTIEISASDTLVSVNDGRIWQSTGSTKGRVTHLVRDPGDSHRIFALVASGGLYQGQVSLPWPWHEVVIGWLAALIPIGLVLASCNYFNLLRTYGLSHRLAWGLLAHFRLLRKLQSPRFQSRLKPMEMLILATIDQPRFTLVEVWEKLDEIGIPTSRSQLIGVLKDLVRYGLLQEHDTAFRYITPGMQIVATHALKGSANALLEGMRWQGRLLDYVERFFVAAGFDVRQDAPRYLTKFILRPRRSLYRDYRRLYAWLRSQGPLQGAEVDAICQEAIETRPPLAPHNSSTEHPVPVAFAVVTELPDVEAFRHVRLRREQVRLIPLSATAIRTALRERSAARDLDMLVQQERSQADLYDVRAPVIDRLDFFGRQEVIASVRGELRKGHSIDVWGLPAIGKTSLLWHLKETLVNPVVAYVDLAYGWPGERAFHDQIIADLANDLWLKYSRFLDDEANDFGEQLLSVVQALPVRGERDAKVVLLLDGCSMVTNSGEQQHTLEHLRRLVNAQPHLALLATWQDAELPATAWKPLGGLDEQESSQLITTIGAQMGLDFTQDSLESIYRETGGHPFLLRQLGSAVARQAPARSPAAFSQVTPDLVEQALSRYRPMRDRYSEDVWQWCSPGQAEGLRHWSQMSMEQRERLLDSDPYLRALMRTDKMLGELLMNWLCKTAGENRL